MGIIGMLIALLPPAVQRMRESAARAQCQHNMRQIATAVHNYHDANGVFPPNGNTSGPDAWISWGFLARLLPYVEQTALYDANGIDATGSVSKNTPDVSSTVNLFLCPSDRAVDYTSSRSDQRPKLFYPNPPGPSNYKGNAGINWIRGEWVCAGTSGQPNMFTAIGALADVLGEGNGMGDGIMFRSDGVCHLSFTSVTDGLSNTFMIGEDVPEFNPYCSWPFANHSTGTCAIPLNTNMDGEFGALAPGQLIEPNLPLATMWFNTYSFRSRHMGGANFAMADGSIRFVPDTISLSVYRALSTRAGGETNLDY
jgi:prepilin-type processing-associated H-X9-DG protein